MYIKFDLSSEAFASKMAFCYGFCCFSFFLILTCLTTFVPSSTVVEEPRQTTYERRFDTIQLPRGWERNDFMVRLVVRVSDTLMATTTVNLQVKVMLPLIGGMIDTRIYIDEHLYGGYHGCCAQKLFEEEIVTLTISGRFRLTIYHNCNVTSRMKTAF